VLNRHALSEAYNNPQAAIRRQTRISTPFPTSQPSNPSEQHDFLQRIDAIRANLNEVETMSAYNRTRFGQGGSSANHGTVDNPESDHNPGPERTRSRPNSNAAVDQTTANPSQPSLRSNPAGISVNVVPQEAVTNSTAGSASPSITYNANYATNTIVTLTGSSTGQNFTINMTGSPGHNRKRTREAEDDDEDDEVIEDPQVAESEIRQSKRKRTKTHKA